METYIIIPREVCRAARGVQIPSRVRDFPTVQKRAFRYPSESDCLNPSTKPLCVRREDFDSCEERTLSVRDFRGSKWSKSGGGQVSSRAMPVSFDSIRSCGFLG